MDYRCGYFAVSKAGHDKRKTYIVWKEEGEYVYLVNGKGKTLEAPKKKRKKHIQIVYRIDHKIEEKLKNNCKITDDDILEAIARYLGN